MHLISHAFTLLTAFCLAVTAAAAPDIVADASTVFLLRADAAKGALVDVTGRFQPEVSGGEVVADPVWGACLKLSAGDKNGITLKDDGKINFERGMTLDAWVCFDELLPLKGASLALKVGSFSWDLQKGKLNTAWLVFPSEEIFTTAPPQFKYFPVGGDTINGLMNVPLKKWTHLTMSYDESLGVVTTLMDGLVDRRRFRYRGAQRLQCDGKSQLSLFSGMKNCRIAAIKLTTGTPDVLPPTMEAYLNALPYRGQVMLTLDHIDPRLPLPIEVAIVWEQASGSSATLQTLTLDSHARRDLMFDAPTWLNSLHTYTVSAAAGGRQCFSRSLRLGNVKPAGRATIHADLTLSREGKKFYPLMMYHAMPQDYARMRELGINLVLNDFNLYRAHRTDPAGYVRELVQCLDAAQQHGLGMIVSANAAFGKLHTLAAAKDHPAALLWYGDDEPWGDLGRLHESYNTIKLLDPHLPVLVVQNNYSRLQDTAPAADILATDPYPVPNVSLRAVADATQSAIRAVAGRKPVWTVLPQYGGKVPTREELRCMVWIAIASRANGLGFFTWDERIRDASTGALKGWFTPEHPEQIEDLRIVLQELRPLEPMLLAPPAAQQPTLQPANPALHVLIKEADGKRWLIVANDSRRTEETTLEFGATPDADAQPLSAGSATLSLRNGKAPLKLPPLGVAVFELKTR
ncbi:hypothetical protein [Prosthecobacter sp.]|uniref:hypothetical protein n=1 Tax=Prosthecobacter sp. TaxID=1965333 RepID=UPI002ABB58C8|nr:hypothetical protein [Prosthecobacter sp.]MDZ4402347.1 hypothetical protein [Prosthecobacter sp.]